MFCNCGREWLFTKKKCEETHRVAQPPTLAAFLPWGSSEGADRMSLTGAKVQCFLTNQNFSSDSIEKIFQGKLLGCSAVMTTGSFLTGCMNDISLQ